MESNAPQGSGVGRGGVVPSREDFGRPPQQHRVPACSIIKSR